MGFGDLFKSKAEREKEKRKKRRKAFRDVETAVDKVRIRIAKLKSERDKYWHEARGYLKAGQKEGAQRSLQTVRASEVTIGQLEKKRWVFEQISTKMEIAGTDQEFASALTAIQDVMEIDPEAISETLDSVQDKLGEQDDVEKIWSSMHDREMSGVERMSDIVPSVEDMMKNLEDEVVADVRGDKIADSAEPTGSINEAIGAGRQKLNDLLEDGK